jgi:DNA-binding IclR family transcriptional regulator
LTADARYEKMGRNMKQRSTKSRNQPAPRRASGSASGTQAVTRALLLLDTLGGARDEWALGELVDELAMRKTTVFRLLGALEGAGFVVRDAERQTYRLGPALIRLGARARRSVGLHDAAHPELRALAAETGESATLEVLVNEETLILDEVQGGHIIGSSPEVGMRWPAHATSTGKVLLAARGHYEGEDPARAPRGKLVRMAPGTITSWARLERELEEVRRRGYAVGMEEIEAGFVAIAAPVRDDEGRVVAAISVGGPKARLHGARIAQVAALVRDGADRISARLGAPATHSGGGTGAEQAAVAPRVTRRAETRRRIGRSRPVRAK